MVKVIDSKTKECKQKDDKEVKESVGDTDEKSKALMC